MLAGSVLAPGTARTSRVSVPEAAPDEVLVHVEGCGVCGSSLPYWTGREWFTYPGAPGAPGHEVWGRLEDGRRVAALCYRGYAELDVAAADTIVELPAELDDLPFQGEALACAVNVAAAARGERVAVVGMGFLGTAVARILGDVTEIRRDTAVEGPFDVVVEAAGTQDALDTASRLVAPGGHLVIAGYHQDGLRSIDLGSWNWRAIEIVNAHERDRQAYVRGMREAIALALDGIIDLEELVTHRFPLERLEDAFELARTRPRGFLKAVVCP